MTKPLTIFLAGLVFLAGLGIGRYVVPWSREAVPPSVRAGFEGQTPLDVSGSKSIQNPGATARSGHNGFGTARINRRNGLNDYEDRSGVEGFYLSLRGSGMPTRDIEEIIEHMYWVPPANAPQADERQREITTEEMRYEFEASLRGSGMSVQEASLLAHHAFDHPDEIHGLTAP